MSAADQRVGSFVQASTTAGLVKGAWRNNCAVFLGIPFAQPPVGPLRFAAPVPHEPWEGVRDALVMGATPQRGDNGITLIPEPSVEGESTLNVNVFTPSPGADASLPVLVYIHGGGFTSGSPASTWYDGTAFARDGAVTVVISYRLGFEGFGWVEGAPHNRGVMDWLLALEWVQENIASFGGDPGRVTIAGQSAGGGAVLTLLGMEKAHHLFQGVYCMSGVAADVPVDKARDFAMKFAKTAGVAPTRAGFELVPEEKLRALQKKAIMPKGMPLKALQSLATDGLILGPVMDGVLITQPTIDSIRSGVGSHIPLVIGSADDEFSMIFAMMKKIVKFIPTGFLLGGLGMKGERRARYLAANQDVVPGGSGAIAGRFLTDSIFRTFIVNFLEARGDAPTWVYRFSWRSPVFGYAIHCIDVPFFFDVLDKDAIAALAGDAPPQKIADELHADASRFLAEADPGWPQYGAKATTKVFDVESTVIDDGYQSVLPLL